MTCFVAAVLVAAAIFSADARAQTQPIDLGCIVPHAKHSPAYITLQCPAQCSPSFGIADYRRVRLVQIEYQDGRIERRRVDVHAKTQPSGSCLIENADLGVTSLDGVRRITIQR